MKTKPNLKEYFVLPNPGLLAYFKHTVEGNAEDYRPPFFKGKSREEVLELWEARLATYGAKSNYPGLYDYEEEMKGKAGPMSFQLPLEEREESINDYFTDIDLKSEPIKEAAIDQAVRFFSRAGGIRMKSRANTLKEMKLSTNSGPPWFTKRKNVVEYVLQSYLFLRNGEWYVSTPDGTFKVAAVLGWRGQEGGIDFDDVKQRVIWMMSILLNIEELRFYQPAIKAIQAKGVIPAYVSMDAVDREITLLFDSRKNPKQLIICTDFKRFDQHFNPDMQNAAKLIEQRLFNDSGCWIKEVFPAKFEIPLICSEDLMFYGSHGMGSGSGGTNFDECMAHKALQFEVALENGHRLNDHSMAYGDDGVLTYPGITVDQIVECYSRHGQIMNPDKQYASDHDCVVLRRWHDTSYRVNNIMVGVYSTFRALGRLLAQERFYDPKVWNEKMVVLRALSIIENCKWSPWFHEFIDFVMTGDDFGLGTRIPGFFDDLEHLAQEAMNEFTDFLGYTKTLQDDNPAQGINDWEVVKYLKSKL